MTIDQGSNAPPGSGPSDAELRSAVPTAAGAHEVRVGIFVLMAVVSFMAVLFLMTDPASFRGRYMITTTVNDAGGIRKGDPVQMKGVNIGRVHDFDIRGDGVGIVLEIEGEWGIPDDSRTQLASTGLLGGVTVEVLRGNGSTMVRDGAELPGRSATNLFETADALGTQAQGVLGQIEGLLSESTVSSVEQSAADLSVLLRSLSELSRSQSGEIAALTASLNRSAGGLESASPALQRALAQADTTMTRLSVTSETLDRAASSLEVILERIASGEGALGRLSTDDTLYDNLAAAAESIRELTTDLRENPRRYIKLSVF